MCLRTIRIQTTDLKEEIGHRKIAANGNHIQMFSKNKIKLLVNIRFEQIETYLMIQQETIFQHGQNSKGELTANCQNATTSQTENSTTKISLIGLLRISCC